MASPVAMATTLAGQLPVSVCRGLLSYGTLRWSQAPTVQPHVALEASLAGRCRAPLVWGG